MIRTRNRNAALSAAMLLLCCSTRSVADGPTSQQLQQQLAAGSNSGSAAFTSLTAGTIRGDISGATVLPPGSTTTRSLSDEFSDQTEVRHFGAIGDGQHDDSLAFQAAEEAAQLSATSGRTIFVNPGKYLIDSTIYSVSSNSWLIPSGASFLGPGTLAGSTDNDALAGNTALSLLKQSSENGNANALFVSNLVNPSGSTSSYQKNALYARIRQDDPSDSSLNRDAVSVFADGDLAAGNVSGRVWAIDATVLMPSGSDGYGVGLEIGINNDTGTVGNFGQPNSKFGINLFASGSSNSTAAVDIQSSGAKWLDGILMSQSAVVNDAFALRDSKAQDVAAVHQDGSAVFTRIVSTGPIVAGAGVQLAAYALSNLPANCGAGQLAFASDGRNPGEGSGSGSGTPVFCNGRSAWYALSSGQPVTN